MNETADKLEITELVNRLFIHTDLRNWAGLQAEVFTETVQFDMVSMGSGQPQATPSQQICELWERGFQGLDGIHHQGGHYLITLRGDGADVFAYAVATHFKAAATQGQTRTFTGSYDLHAVRTAEGWRLDAFKYNLKFADGNAKLE